MSAMRHCVLALWFAACHGNKLPVDGIVVRHEHHAAHTTTTLMCTGKGGCYPISTRHPERWVVVVHVGQEDVEIETSQAKYERAQEGHTASVIYDTSACGGYELHGQARLEVSQ